MGLVQNLRALAHEKRNHTRDDKRAWQLLYELEDAGHCVDSRFEEGSHGYNWRITVYSIQMPTAYGYFEVHKSVFALDPDEDNAQFTIQEVIPETMTITHYKPI